MHGTSQSGGASLSQVPPHGIGDISPGVNRAMSISMSSLVHLVSRCSTPCCCGVPLTIARQVPAFLPSHCTYHDGAVGATARRARPGTGQEPPEKVESKVHTQLHGLEIGLPQFSPIASRSNSSLARPRTGLIPVNAALEQLFDPICDWLTGTRHPAPFPVPAFLPYVLPHGLTLFRPHCTQGQSQSLGYRPFFCCPGGFLSIHWVVLSSSVLVKSP